MRVDDMRGSETVETINELEGVLSRRYEDGANAFWISPDTEEYPMLAVLIAGELATLNYVPDEQRAGFRSVGGVLGAGSSGTTMFPISSNRADDVAVPDDAVVAVAVAIAAATEFFKSLRLPECMEWFEL